MSSDIAQGQKNRCDDALTFGISMKSLVAIKYFYSLCTASYFLRFQACPPLSPDPAFRIILMKNVNASKAESCFVSAKGADEGKRSRATLTEQRHSAEAKEPMQRCIYVWNQYNGANKLRLSLKEGDSLAQLFTR